MAGQLGDSQSQGAHMSGKFVLKKGAKGGFHFNLLAGNGQVIATSEHYESKASALNGIKSVQTNAPDATVVDETEG
jgi:uncharacterized protein